MATYLVTGGCGFIGSHIAEALVENPANRVILYDNFATGHRANVAPIADRVEIIEADIRDRARVTAACQGVDFLFHEAALVSVPDSVNRPVDNHEINLTGTLHVLDAAARAGVKRVVLASSAAVYGDAPTLPKDESMPPDPISPYGLAKWSTEHYAAAYSRLYNLPVIALRYFNVFGPRQDPSSAYSGVISRFVDALHAGRRPVIYGDGLQSRDFVYVKDVVAANLLAMHHAALNGGEVFNVATGHAVTLLDLLATLGRITGQNVEPLFEQGRTGDIRASLADITLATNALGYTPRHTLEEGLRALVEG